MVNAVPTTVVLLAIPRALSITAPAVVNMGGVVTPPIIVAQAARPDALPHSQVRRLQLLKLREHKSLC